MKKQFCTRILYYMACITIVLAASACSAPVNSQAEMNKEFSLSLGQKVFISGENLEITFREVVEDSRCPRGVTCVWAGRVTCAVELTQAGVSNQVELTATGLEDDYSRMRYEDYSFAFRVTPYPRAGEEISADTYRLHMIITQVTEPTEIIGFIIAEPSAFEGRGVTITGYYRGWDLLHEANITPPVTRSDWVIKDMTGALYVNANSEAKVPEGLNPASLPDTDILLMVTGTVRVTPGGQPYIEATGIERIR